MLTRQQGQLPETLSPVPDRQADAPQPVDHSPEPAQWSLATQRLGEAWTQGSPTPAESCCQSDPNSGPRGPGLPSAILCPQQLEGFLGPAENWSYGDRWAAAWAAGGCHHVSPTEPAGSGPGDVQGCALHSGEYVGGGRRGLSLSAGRELRLRHQIWNQALCSLPDCL